MVEVYDFFEKMEREDIMLSFKGEVTSDLLSSILQIMESKLDHLAEHPKVKKKVFNVLVECLQNLYHHTDNSDNDSMAIFMVSKSDEAYSVITGNYIANENVEHLKGKLEQINKMDSSELKDFYRSVLNNGEMSDKGGGGLGMIDIARKSGQKLNYDFQEVDDDNSFFSLNVKISQ